MNQTTVTSRKCAPSAGRGRPRTIRFVAGLLVAAVVVAAGCSRQQYGEKAFVVITGVDSQNPGNFLLKGAVQIEGSTRTTELPGAVYVVGVPDGVTIEGKQYEYRRVLVRNAKGEVVPAESGCVLSIPKEITILEKTYQPGKIRVAQDGKFPE